jgi:integrase
LAAGTGLRISEYLGLQWQDVSFAEAVIQVRRTWTCGKVGWPKSKASKRPGAAASFASQIHVSLET